MTSPAVHERRQALLRSAAAADEVQQHLGTLSGGVARAARAVPDGPGWQGAAARAAGAHLVLDTDRLARLATGFAVAAEASRRHGAELRAAAAVLAGGDPAQLARAEAVVAASCCRCAAAFASLAASAPPRRTGLDQAMHLLSGWLGEVQLGTGEAVFGLVGATVTAATVPLSPSHRDGALDPGDVLGVVRHPAALAASLLDERTWRENPARAVGHLAPDVVAGLLTGGASTAARARAISRLESAAAERSAAAQARELRFRAYNAATSRASLTDDALDDGLHGPVRAGHPGETGLTRVQNAQADAMYRLSIQAQESVTDRMRKLADEVGADLVGLDRRLKTPASFKRKLVSRLAERRATWPDVLQQNSDDLVRYTLVLNSHRYLPAAREVAAALTRDGLHLERIYPAWNRPRDAYRGLNTIWQDVDTGRMFELQFHTPGSKAAAGEARPFYEEQRLLPYRSPRERELTAAMQEIYGKAPPPVGVERITKEGGSLIPRPPSAPFDPPADLAALHAVLAGTAAGAAGTPSRR